MAVFSPVDERQQDPKLFVSLPPRIGCVFVGSFWYCQKGAGKRSAGMAALGLLVWSLTILFAPQSARFLVSFGVKRKFIFLLTH